jgi:hypothetical protein
MVEPLHGLLHGPGRQSAMDGASSLGSFDQPGVGEHIEMLHDGGQGDRKRLRKLADRDGILIVETGEEGPPGRIRQRGEGAVQGRDHMVNH